MNALDIYFYEAFEEEQHLLEQNLERSSVKAGFTWKTIQESGHKHPEAKIISTRTQSIIPASWVNQITAILSRSTGYDHLVRYRRQTQNSSIHLGYLPLYCHRAVAEQAMLLWTSLVRKLPAQLQKFNEFNRDGLSGLENENKNLLVVGVGNIGYQIVKIGRGLGMQVRGVDIEQKHDDVHYTSIDKGLEQADIIVAAMNLTELNQGYFNIQLFRKARKKPVFVNIARGELSPPAALREALDQRYLSGVALDVYDGERELAHQLRSKEGVEDKRVNILLQLAEYPNVIMTPHNAFNTLEAVQRKAQQSIQQIDYFLQNKQFLWNVPDA
ncbi:MAG: hydroxyacid dehydrogenase [Caldithrix sp.]|nr:hydroxyacid dehydrogenase [Caldithrix sp.]